MPNIRHMLLFVLIIGRNLLCNVNYKKHITILHISVPFLQPFSEINKDGTTTILLLLKDKTKYSISMILSGSISLLKSPTKGAMMQK